MVEIKHVIHEVTGYPLDFIQSDLNLESDLGIDSIKKITIIQKIVSMLSKEMQNKLSKKYETSEILQSVTIKDLEDIFGSIVEEKKPERDFHIIQESSVVKRAIADITGIDEGLIYEDSNLESDLGIDSIKKIAFINRLAVSIGENDVEGVAEQEEIDTLVELKTVKEFELAYQRLTNIKGIINTEEDGILLSNQIPISNSQYTFLLSYWTVGTMSLVSRVQLKGVLDIEKLSRSWKILAKKQPSLQASYQCDKSAKKISDYRLHLFQGDFDYGIPVYDLRQLNKINQDLCIKQFCEKIINNKFDIFTFPLHQFYVFQLSDDSFQLLLASSHLISDGLGMQQILRDMLYIYDIVLDVPDCNEEELLKGVSILEYQNNLQAFEKELENQQAAASEAKRYRFPVCLKNGKDRYGYIASLTNMLTKADTARLKEFSGSVGSSLYSILVSSYLLALQSIDIGSEFITLNLPTSGKVGESFDLTDTVGCFAQNLSITFDSSSHRGESLVDYVKYVQQKVNMALLNQEDLKQGTLVEKQLADQEILIGGRPNPSFADLVVNTIKSNVYLSYVGDIKYSEDYENFEITDYAAYTGTNKDAVDILIELVQGKLMFSINYDKNAYAKQDIQLLYDRIKYYLMKFISIPLVEEIRIAETYLAQEVVENHSKDGICSFLDTVIEELTGVGSIDYDKNVELVYGISSIEKMKILTRVLGQYNVEDKVRLFQFQTLNELLSTIQQSQKLEKSSTNACAPSQKWIFNYFEGNCKWGGYTRFTYNGELDTEVFEKAFNRLICQNDVLRMRFDDSQKTVMSVFEEFGPCDIKYFTPKTIVNEREWDEQIQKMIENELEDFDIKKLPLIKVRIIVLPGEKHKKFEFILIGNHLILDMVGNSILFDRLWKNYDLLLNGDEKQRVDLDHSFEDYIRKTIEYKNKYGREYLKYWENKFHDRQKTIFPFYRDGESNYEIDEGVVERTLSKKQTKALQHYQSFQKEFSFYHILLEPLYRCVSLKSGLSEVVISHRSHGRNLGKETYMNTPGNFAVNFPISLSVAKKSRTELIEEIRNEFHTVPLNGVSYDLCADELNDAIYPDNKLTTIRSNYLGNIDSVRLPEVIEFKSEHLNQRFGLEKHKRISDIEFFFSIENEELHVKIAYPKRKCTESDISGLMEQYFECLNYFIGKAAPELEDKKKKNQNLKTVVITGGSRGIGKAAAEKYLKNNYRVILIAKDSDRLKACAGELRAKFNKDCVICYPVDILDHLKLEKISKEIEGKFGILDALVCCAGVTMMKEMTSSSPYEWMNIIQVNLFGTFHTLHAFVPILKRQKEGSIVIVGSDSSYIGYPLMSAYAASKHGLVGLVKSLSEEVKLYNINVNLICPTLVNTDMAPVSLRKNALRTEEVADVLYQYTNEDMRAVSGTVVKINGKKDMYWFASKDMGNLSALVEA